MTKRIISRNRFEILFCLGDESDIQDFIPISPPVTFNPTLGQLEVLVKDPLKGRQRRFSGREVSQRGITIGNRESQGKGFNTGSTDQVNRLVTDANRKADCTVN